MSRVFIGVGSNEGDRLTSISTAISRLGATPCVRLVRMATIIETEPVGGPPQDAFLNTAVEAETSLEPRALLNALKEIEWHLGRRPSLQRWAARPIDLDLLLYDDRVIEAPDCSVPHPRLHERWFVLSPLAQLAPDVVHPILRETIASLLTRLPASSRAR